MLRHCHRHQVLRSQALQFGSGLSIGGFIDLLQHLRVALGAGTCFSSKSTTRTWEFGQMIRWLGPSTTGLSLTGHYLKRGALNSDWGWETWGLMGFSDYFLYEHGSSFWQGVRCIEEDILCRCLTKAFRVQFLVFILFGITIRRTAWSLTLSRHSQY